MLELLSNILLGVSLAAPIGPVSVEVIKRGLRKGFFSAFPVCLGAALGDTFYLVLTFFGLAPFLVSPFSRVSILLFGSAVLLFLGFQTIRDSFRGKTLSMDDVNEEKNAIVLGFALAVINPMTVVWWMGVFGAVLGNLPAENLTFSSLLWNLSIILGVLLWSLFLSLFLHFGKHFVTEKGMRAVTGIAGLSLMGFGLKFGFNAIIDFLQFI